MHQLKCCAMPGFAYSSCEKVFFYNTLWTLKVSLFRAQVSSDWGGQIDCREAGDLLMVEGQCHSGKGHDCSGSANIVDCCPGQ